MSTQQQSASETFGQFLSRQFLEWERKQGKRMKIVQFVAYINQAAQMGWDVVKRSAFTHHLDDDRVPTDADIIEAYARVFGPEVYDVLGLQRPDPVLKYIASNWEAIPGKTRDEIVSLINGIVKKPKEGAVPARRTRKSVA